MNLQERKALARYREWRDAHAAEEQEITEHARRVAMSKVKTKQGTLVKGPPDTTSVRQMITDVRELLVEVFEEAEHQKALQTRMSKASAVDRERFQSIGGA